MKLTTSTLNSLGTGICVQDLPKSIRDAVDVTVKLGLELLWVDALCIIQDSVEDWTREAAAMGDVYSNSFITPAAVGASSSDDGFFAHRDPLLYEPCQLARVNDSWMEAKLHTNMSVVRDSMQNWALHERGWVVQERILPPRMLNLGPFLFWECRERVKHEFSPDCGNNGSFSHDLHTLSGDLFGNVLRMTGLASSAVNIERIMKFWARIVSLYSKASFTIQSDKAAAILGIVFLLYRRARVGNTSVVSGNLSSGVTSAGPSLWTT